MDARYTKGEELANSLTHGLGVVLSIAGLVVLVVCAAVYGNAWHIVSFSIYGSSLIVLYASSTLYHSVKPYTVKKVFRILDHSAIFILIAGTYTPFMLVNIGGAWGWSIFGIIWACTISGIVLNVFFIGKFQKLSIAIYMGMGWLCVAASKEIVTYVPHLSIALLVLGGLFYTFGVIFYVWRKLPYGHAVWHLFVLAGSIFHYCSVLFTLWGI